MKIKLFVILICSINLVNCEGQKTKVGLLHVVEAKDDWSIYLPLKELFADSAVKAILITLDDTISYGSAEALTKDIKYLKDKFKKPVFVYSENLLFGSNYLFACCADQIIISPVTSVGLIGLYQNYPNFIDRNSKEGTLLNVIHSGKYKTSMDPNCIFNSEILELKQKMVNSNFSRIVENIISLRPKLKESKSSWINGERLDAQSALKNYKMVDQVCDKLSLMEHILETLKIEELTFENIEFITKKVVKDFNNLDFPSERSDSYIAVIKIDKLGASSWQYLQTLYELFKHKDIKGIILSINCYGSYAYISTNLYNEIIKLKAIYKKPVVGYVSDHAFSGGFHIACACDYVIASEIAEVGSIGVRLDRWDYTKKNENDLIKFNQIKTGKYLDTFDKNVVLSSENKKMLEIVSATVYNQFVGDVMSTRLKLKNVDKSLWAEGQIFSAQDALNLGLVDQLGSITDALKYINKSDDTESIALIFKTFADNDAKRKKKKNRPIDLEI